MKIQRTPTFFFLIYHLLLPGRVFIAYFGYKNLSTRMSDIPLSDPNVLFKKTQFDKITAWLVITYYLVGDTTVYTFCQLWTASTTQCNLVASHNELDSYVDN